VVISGLVFAGSAWTFVNYLGAAALVLAAAWSVVAAIVIDAAARRLSWRWAVRGAVALGVVAVAVFAVAYPRLDTHDRAAGGSDRDDDADVAVLAAAHGDYLFGARTYLGNEVTHLPGSLIVAAPFVAIGGSAVENVAVLPVAVFVLARKTRSAEALILVVGTVAASAGVWHEFLTGGNSLAEWTLLSMAAVWLATETRTWTRAVAFGFALNVRANALTAGATGVGVAARDEWLVAVRVAVIAGFVQLVLVAPFLLGGLARFTPFSSGSAKVAHLDALFAHASTVLPVVAAVASALAAFVIARSTRLARVPAVLAGLAASQLVQFGALIAFSLAAGSAAWAENWCTYLMLAVIPGATALALSAQRSPRFVA
jgi:hypothetical protein